MGLDFPNIPYFKDGDLAITESLAIHRYIADKWKPELLGSDAQHRAHVSMLSHIINDLKWSIVPDCYGSGDKVHLMQLVHEKMPPVVKYLGDKKYLTGDQPCWVDFYFFETIQILIFVSEGSVLETYPSLKVYNDNFKQLPGLKEYLATCEDKDMTFNNKSAKINGKLGFW